MDKRILELIKQGKATVIGNKVYCECRGCGQLIQVNKTLFGSLHLCVEGETRK